MRLEVAGPAHIAAPPREAPRRWDPWLEAGLLVRVMVSEWQHREETWSHWATPCAPDGSPAGEPRRFAPGRFALVPGAPESTRKAGAPALTEPLAGAFVANVLARWHPVLHRQPELELVSRLDEPRDEFRKRCLSLFRPLLQGGGVTGPVLAGRIAAIAAAIESVPPPPPEIDVAFAHVTVVWYPEGMEPELPPAELMIAGAVRGER